VVVDVSVNNNNNVSTRMADDFFNPVSIKYLCQSCVKQKNITFFLLDVFLHPNVLHELTSLQNLSNKNHYIISKQQTIDKNVHTDYFR